MPDQPKNPMNGSGDDPRDGGEGEINTSEENGASDGKDASDESRAVALARKEIGLEMRVEMRAIDAEGGEGIHRKVSMTFIYLFECL